MAENLSFVKNYMEAENVLSSAQNFTTGWVDVGSEISVPTLDKVNFWISHTINDTLNAQYRVLAKLSHGATKEYYLPIYTSGASKISMDDELFEYNVDENTNALLVVYPEQLVGFLQLQAQCGTVGSTAGTIDEVNYTAREL